MSVVSFVLILWVQNEELSTFLIVLFGILEEMRVINKNPLYDLKYRGFLFI